MIEPGRSEMPVEIVGVKDVINGLTFIDEDMYRRVKLAVEPVMKGVEAKAKGFVVSNSDVLSGWAKPISSTVDYRPFPKYNSDTVRGGIGYKEGQNRRFSNGYTVESYVYNISAAGRIYETAGRLNPQGRAPFTSVAEGGGTMAFKQSGNRKSKNRSTSAYNSNNPFAGYQFVTDLPTLTSQPKVKGARGGGRKTKGRLIYKAWAQDSGDIYGVIVKAINATATHFNKTTEKKVA
jgi:hypothetical protein